MIVVQWHLPELKIQVAWSALKDISAKCHKRNSGRFHEINQWDVKRSKHYNLCCRANEYSTNAYGFCSSQTCRHHYNELILVCGRVSYHNSAKVAHCSMIFIRAILLKFSKLKNKTITHPICNIILIVWYLYLHSLQ